MNKQVIGSFAPTIFDDRDESEDIIGNAFQNMTPEERQRFLNVVLRGGREVRNAREYPFPPIQCVALIAMMDDMNISIEFAPNSDLGRKFKLFTTLQLQDIDRFVTQDVNMYNILFDMFRALDPSRFPDCLHNLMEMAEGDKDSIYLSICNVAKQLFNMHSLIKQSNQQMITFHSSTTATIKYLNMPTDY